MPEGVDEGDTLAESLGVELIEDDILVLGVSWGDSVSDGETDTDDVPHAVKELLYVLTAEMVATLGVGRDVALPVILFVRTVVMLCVCVKSRVRVDVHVTITE